MISMATPQLPTTSGCLGGEQPKAPFGIEQTMKKQQRFTANENAAAIA